MRVTNAVVCRCEEKPPADLALAQIVELYQSNYITLAVARGLAKRHAKPMTHTVLLKRLHGLAA